MDEVLRRRRLCRTVGLSYSTICRLEKSGAFPARRRLGPGSVGWLRSEVEAWMEEAAPVAGPETDAPETDGPETDGPETDGSSRVSDR